jgi:2',3'-cyclic-nucleotide 2'-phosphodiesterase (5'-nucleotidase family)
MTKILRTATLFAALGLAAMLWSATTAAQTVDLTIVHVNDVSRAEEVAGRGGLAKLATIVARERAKGHPVIVTLGGNAISPSLLSGVDQGAHMIDLLNQVGVDVMAVGNHEFDFGPAVLSGRALEARFKMLTANARQRDGRQIDGTQPSWMTEIEGFKLGFFGLTRQDTPTVSQPGETMFEPPMRAARRLAEELRAQGAQLVIALANLNRGDSDALVKSGLVDLVLGSSNEVLRTSYDGRTAFAASSPQATYVAVIDLKLEMRDVEMANEPTAGSDGTIDLQNLVPTIESRFQWSPSFRTIDTADIDDDPAVGLATQRYLNQLSDNLGKPIGVTDIALDTREVALRSENAFGGIVADAMRRAVGGDAALLNVGAIRGDRRYAEGTTLTRQSLLEELPFRNRVLLLRVNGGQLLSAIENGLSEVDLGTGRFPQVSGLTITYDPKRAPGDRIVSVTIGGRLVLEDRMYNLATLDFLANGGDGYTMLTTAQRLIDENSGVMLTQAVVDYITATGGIHEAPAGRRLVPH